MEFNSFSELNDYCFQIIGCKLYAGVGISIKRKLEIAILRSVPTYYCDDLTVFPLYGPAGDQDINEKRFNRPLFKMKYVYLYEVKNRKYIWYNYIKRSFTKTHCNYD